MSGDKPVLNNLLQNYGTPFTGTLAITATPEGGNNDLVKGHCKRIVFSYDFPVGAKYWVSHIAMNGMHDQNKYITWCGLYVKKVIQSYNN